MNTPLPAPELTNDAIVDSNLVVNQRARDLLCSITAKREQLEQHQKSAGTIGLSVNATTTKAQSSTMAMKIHEALREKRSRLRKHLRFEATAVDDHQDNTQTTETSTATPGASPCPVLHTPFNLEVLGASECIPSLLHGDDESASALMNEISVTRNFLPLSKSFDETRSPEPGAMLRRTRSLDSNLLIRKMLVVSNSSRDKADHTKTKRKTEATREQSAGDRNDGLEESKLPMLKTTGSSTRNDQGRAHVLKKRHPSKNRLSTRSRSFDTIGRRPRVHSPQIKVSMSLDRGLSHSTLKIPSGDRQQHLLSFNDIEIPLEISPIDVRSSNEDSVKATVSRRTGSKLIDSSNVESHQGRTLKTKKERVAYIDEIYRTPPKLHMQTAPSNPRDKRKDKAELDRQIIKSHHEENLKANSTPLIIVGHNYDKASSNGEDLMRLSLQDDSDRREMLRRLQLDLNRPKPMAKMMEVVRQAALDGIDDDSSTEEYLSFSDDSSCDFTTTTEITGVGSVISAIEVKKKTIVSFAHQLSQQGENKVKENATTKVLHGAASESVSNSFKSEQTSKAQEHAPLLFVNQEDADRQCSANGGLADIATKSGFDRLDNVPLKPLPRVNFIRPPIRLSTDYRCGTYGSSYDIALRSGYLTDFTTALPPKRKTEDLGKAKMEAVAVVHADVRKYFARGSHYDIALQSGLTKQMIRTRSSFSFTVQQKSKGRRPCLLSANESDRRCGACGSMYLAATCREKRPFPRNIFRSGLYSIQELDVE